MKDFAEKRRAAIAECRLGVDAEGRYVSVSEENAVAILNASLKDAASEIREHAMRGGFHLDDDSDYLSACVDQVTTIVAILNRDDGEGVQEKLLELLNSREWDVDAQTLEGREADAAAFSYGYADHESIISILAHVNDSSLES